jgi:hypothetical protein
MLSAGAVAALEDTRVVIITDNWVGLSLLAPIGREYILRQAGEAFRGRATFSLGGMTSARVDLVVPDDTMRVFIETLSRTPIREGSRYEPMLQWTDDFPHRTIVIDTPGGQVEFETESQGEGNVPWRLSCSGRSCGIDCVIDADTPAKALNDLQPFLRQDVFEQLERDVIRRISRHSIWRMLRRRLFR